MELQPIQEKIFEIRNRRVMLDFDLARLYQVQTKRLKEQVKRNKERFPDDFMFQLSDTEWEELVAICDQFPAELKHSYIRPTAFTEQGVSMLSAVLRSDENLEAVNDLSEDIRSDIETLYDAIGALSIRLPQNQLPRTPIGFKK